MVNELQRQLGASMHSQKIAEASCLVAERQLERLKGSSIEVSQSGALVNNTLPMYMS